jgi:hypothetical protein
MITNQSTTSWASIVDKWDPSSLSLRCLREGWTQLCFWWVMLIPLDALGYWNSTTMSRTWLFTKFQSFFTIFDWWENMSIFLSFQTTHTKTLKKIDQSVSRLPQCDYTSSSIQFKQKYQDWRTYSNSLILWL